VVLALGGGIGIFSGGLLADALRRRGQTGAELWPGIISALAILPFGIATAQAGSGDAALLRFAGFMFFSSFAFAAAAAALQVVTPNRLRGQVSALYLFFVNLGGIGLGSFLTGWINDAVFHDPGRVGDSMAWVIGLAAPAAALLLLAALPAYRRMQREA
jgi:MFS family permease